MHEIKFIKNAHKYYTENNLELISVSKFTERFKQKQDWGAIAKRSAKKANVSTEILQAQWDLKKKVGTEVGTLLHSIKETELINEENPEFYNVICSKKLCGVHEEGKLSIPINSLENNTVYPELMIYDMEYMLCGQADKVIVVDDRINVWDYKSDKKIDFVGYSNKWTSARKFLAPINHLDDCNANMYSLKMSLYMYMLWKANKGKLKPGELVLEHVTLKRDEEGMPLLEGGAPIVLKTEIIKLPYRKKEVQEMLKTLK